ncbi:MAG TPA: hypothetical protein VKE98_22105 [Gemmataceae bacterium]|nr:hypothetical protein [Gemmataceae bacterium]
MRHSKTASKAEYQDAVDEFVIPSNHPHGEGHQWLSSFLKRLDWSKLKDPSLWGFRTNETDSLSPKVQIALLKSCIERMIWLRDHRKRTGFPEQDQGFWINYDIGGVVYGIAIDLFQRPLPFSEDDICEILESMHHDCGHGGDVTPPFDLTLAYARKHQLSTKLLTALKHYVEGLRKVNSTIARGVKRKSALLFVLDDSCGEQHCWSDRFRQGLKALPERQQKDWRAMIIQMDAVEFARNKKTWKNKVPQFIENLGANHILKCLSAWWPAAIETHVWPLETGGSYLLQHFVWLLEVIAEDEKYAQRCDSLVVQLSALDWKPKERAQKVMVAAAQYLEQRPPEVSWTALQELNAWSESVGKKPGYSTGSAISKALTSFAKKHQLSSNKR